MTWQLLAFVAGCATAFLLPTRPILRRLYRWRMNAWDRQCSVWAVVYLEADTVEKRAYADRMHHRASEKRAQYRRMAAIR